MGIDVIKRGNSDTVVNVRNVKLIEACRVCRKFRNEQAQNMPMLCSKCFHKCKLKGFQIQQKIMQCFLHYSILCIIASIWIGCHKKSKSRLKI